MFLFLIRLIKSIGSFLLVDVVLQLVGAVILLPFCAAYEIGKLPRFLRWFDSADPFVGRDTEVIDRISKGQYTKYSFYPIPETKLQLTLNKYIWLAWRNPLNYFQYKVSGLEWKEPVNYVRYSEEEVSVGDSTGDHAGLRHIEVDVAGKRYYEYYFIHKWNDKTCFRFRMGWKVSDKDNPIGTYSQSCFVISPYKSFSGV